MNVLKNPDNLYNDIINNKITISTGLNQLLSNLKEGPDMDIEYEIIEILNKLIVNIDEIVDFLIEFFLIAKDMSRKLFLAKFLIQNNIEKSFNLLKNELETESSAYYITHLYEFLNKKDQKIYKNLREIIINKYRKTYEVISEEAQFFLDLEATQIESSNRIDFKIGYFNKFKANNMQILNNDKYYNYVIKDSHIIALSLSRWEINELPESIGSLSQLQSLRLTHLKLKNIPESIKSLNHLKNLDLSGNNFKKIPQWLSDFIERKFSQKYMEEGVDPADSKVLSLMEILKGNRIEKMNTKSEIINGEIVSNYQLNKNGNIIGLYLDNEKAGIGIFPKILCSLKYLQELILSNSCIESIPSCIGELQSLKFLDLSFNRIRSVPESIITLKNLEYLNLDDNEIPEQTFSLLIWNKSGQLYIEKGEYDKAITECKKTLEIYPRNKKAWFHLGLAYNEKGDYYLAEEAFQRFLQIDPISPVVLDYLSDIYHNKGDFSKAAHMIKQAIEIEPNVAILWSNLGFNFKKLGKYDKAIEAYLVSLEINPKNQNVWRDLATIYRDKGDYMKAIEADERALEIEMNYKKDNDE